MITSRNGWVEIPYIPRLRGPAESDWPEDALFSPLLAPPSAQSCEACSRILFASAEDTLRVPIPGSETRAPHRLRPVHLRRRSCQLIPAAVQCFMKRMGIAWGIRFALYEQIIDLI
jgi:hypothetical protein